VLHSLQRKHNSPFFTYRLAERHFYSARYGQAGMAVNYITAFPKHTVFINTKTCLLPLIRATLSYMRSAKFCW